MTCPSCSATVRAGALVCTACWTDLPAGEAAGPPGDAVQDDARELAHASAAPAEDPGSAAPSPAAPLLEPPPNTGRSPRAGRGGRAGKSWSTPVEVWRSPAGLLGGPGPGPGQVTGPGPFAAPATATGTSGLAIAALVLGVLWLGGLGSLAAVVLGVMALRQLRRADGQRGGRGLAIAGAALGGVGLVATLLLASIAIPTFLAAREAAALETTLWTATVDQETARKATGS